VGRELLTRWLNHHLSFYAMEAKDYGASLSNSECLLALLDSVQQARASASPMASSPASKRGSIVAGTPPLARSQSLLEAARSRATPFRAPDGAPQEVLLQRAAEVVIVAEKLGSPLFGIALPRNIVGAHEKVLLALVACVFAARPNLPPLTEQEEKEIEKAGLLEDDVGDDREERAFRMWMNSSGISVYVSNLFMDCRDGLALLQMEDVIMPGIVDWKKVEKKPSNKFQMVSNANYAVLLAKERLKCSLVGIGGADIFERKKKPILALIWQLMRFHTVKLLHEQKKRFGGESLSDEAIVEWANKRVASKGKMSSISSFRDPALKTSRFLIDLLWSVEPRIIDWNLVHKGENDEECRQNAAYTISVARKLGATVFLLPEDIVDVKPKMIMTLVASIMAKCIDQ
jgi:plastin-1